MRLYNPSPGEKVAFFDPPDPICFVEGLLLRVSVGCMCSPHTRNRCLSAAADSLAPVGLVKMSLLLPAFYIFNWQRKQIHSRPQTTTLHAYAMKLP